MGLAFDSASGEKRAFAAHARANAHFDIPRLLKALGLDPNTAALVWFSNAEGHSSPYERETHGLDSDKLREFKEEYEGRISPFSVNLIFNDVLDDPVAIEDIWHIFDESLGFHGGCPDTLMSNLYDRRLAFELHPSDLIHIIEQIFPKTVIRSIAEPCPIWLGRAGQHLRDHWLDFPPPTGPKIGILTGNSPESGLTLWADVLKRLRLLYRNLPDMLMPEVQILSLPQMGLSMELVERENHVWAEMEKAIIALLETGCKILTIACNTTIYFEPRITQLCAKYGARFISIAEACMPGVRRALEDWNGEADVGLVGIGPVIDIEGSHSGYKRHLAKVEIKPRPCAAEDLARKVKNTGPGASPQKKKKLVDEFRFLIKKKLPDVHVVILALTEVSMLYRDHIAMKRDMHELNKVFIDPLLELAKYLLLIYLEQGYRESPACQIPADFDIKSKLVKRLELDV